MGNKQIVTINEIDHAFGAGSVLPIMMSQSFWFKHPADIVLWQFSQGFTASLTMMQKWVVWGLYFMAHRLPCL